MPVYSRGQFEEELVAAHGSCLRFARWLTGSNTGAEDLLHDVLLPMMSRVDRGVFNIDAPLETYIKSSLRKRTYSMWKAKSKKDVPVSVQILIECCDQDVRNDVFGSELMDLIKLIADVAGTRQMAALVMYELFGYTYKEIAQMTRIGSAATIHTHRANAIDAMRAYYDGLDPGSGSVGVSAGGRPGVGASASMAPSGEQFMNPDSEES